MRSKKKPPLNEGDYYTALDRTSVFLNLHGEALDECEAIKQDSEANALWEKAQENLSALYQHLGAKWANFRVRVAYVDETDFTHHLTEDGDPHGTRFYNTPGDLKRKEKCWEECGIIKVKVYEEGWAVKPKKGYKVPKKQK